MLNDLSKERLNALDPYLLQAIREVFNEVIEAERVAIQPTEDNLIVGQKYRAYEKAKQIIDKAFINLGSYQQGTKTIKKFNKAN